MALAGARAEATRLWETPPDPESGVAALAISADGKWMAVATFDAHTGSHTSAAVRLYDAATHQLVRSIQREASAVAFTPDGKTLAVATLGIELYDVATFTLKATLDPGRDEPFLGPDGPTVVQAASRTLAISPDGKTLAAISSMALTLFRLPDGRRLAHVRNALPGSGDGVLAFTPDGKLLVGRNEGPIELRSPADGSLLRNVTPDGATNLTVFADGKRLAAGRTDFEGNRPVVVWDLASGKRSTPIKSGRPLDGVAISPDGRYLVGVGQTTQAHLWLLATPDDDDEVLSGHGSSGPRSGTTCARFFPDGKSVAVGGFDGRVIVFAPTP